MKSLLKSYICMKKPETRKTCLSRNEYYLDHDKNL